MKDKIPQHKRMAMGQSIGVAKRDPKAVANLKTGGIFDKSSEKTTKGCKK